MRDEELSTSPGQPNPNFMTKYDNWMKCVCVSGGGIFVLARRSGNLILYFSFVCPSSALPVPTIDGEARHYVSPDGNITLTCRFSSLHLFGTTWLLNGEDVSSTLGEGNSISGDPTTSTLTFTKFDAALHSGTYQCRVQGLLGDLVSRTVDVLPAGEW